MKRFVFAFITSLIWWNLPVCHAGMITATLTADNHYGLFTGQLDGSGLRFIGRNEYGLAGSPGGYGWSLPETFTFTPNPGDYLYTIAWNDYYEQMWVGQFNLPDGSKLFSNLTDWEYANGPPNSNPGIFGDLPSNSTIADIVSTSSWSTPQASMPQGSQPWGVIPGISHSAEFIWSDTLNIGTFAPAPDRFVIFRSRSPVIAAAVPEPSSSLLCLIAGLCFGARAFARSRA